MADELRREWMQSKNYCIDRLGSLKSELEQLQNEGLALRAELESTIDTKQAGLIRRRRMYLSRRINELKAERAARTEELQKMTEQLKAVPT